MNIYDYDRDGLNALHRTVRAGLFDLVRDLVEKMRIDVNIPSRTGMTALDYAAVADDLKMFFFLEQSGADPFLKGNDGGTVLHEAAMGDAGSIIYYLLDEKHFHVETKDDRGQTALFEAARYNSLDALRILVEHGADVNARSNDGATALPCAGTGENFETVRYLAECGADLDAGDGNGMTPLLCAIASDQYEMALYFIGCGADVNRKDKEGNTALHLAATKADLEFVKSLLEHGADVQAENGDGQTALALAESWGNTDIVQLLQNMK